MASLGTKRSVESEQSASTTSSQPSKRPKTGSIMDYMNHKAQSRPKPAQHQADKTRHGKFEETDKNTPSHPPRSESVAEEAAQADGEEPSESRPACGSTSKYFNSEHPASKQIASEQSGQAPKEAFEHLSLPELTGDIFDAPQGTLIIHACNCQGSWGAGIAAAFKSHYPAAYKVYAAQCRQRKNQLFESAQLIPPQKLDRKGHFVGCLYTSRFYGKKKDTPGKILSATAPAMQDLLEKVDEWNSSHTNDERIKEVRMCMINSGLFAVPWEKTRAALETIDVSNLDVKGVKVISREE